MHSPGSAKRDVVRPASAAQRRLVQGGEAGNFAQPQAKPGLQVEAQRPADGVTPRLDVAADSANSSSLSSASACSVV